jgi:hypothetical protein
MLSSKVRGLLQIFICSAAKWARQDSNLRPTGYEPAALPLSYEPALSAMKGFIFHGVEIRMYQKAGLKSTTPFLKGESFPRPHFYHL